MHLSCHYLFQTSAVNEYNLCAKYPAIYSALKGPLDDDKNCNPVVKRNVQNMAKEVAKREQTISKKSPVNNHPSGISTSTKTSEQRSTFGHRENTGCRRVQSSNSSPWIMTRDPIYVDGTNDS